MPTPTARYALLQARLGRLPPLLRGLEQGDPRANPTARVALWRLRELLPVLQLDPETARKLGARLRKISRRLGKVRELDAQFDVMDDLSESERHARQAATRLKNDIRRRRARLGLDAQKKAAGDFHRALRKLDTILENLHRAADVGTTTRAIRWAVKARIARRAATLKHALDEAGSVYLPGRLRDVGEATRKLHFGAELVADVVGGSEANDLRPAEQTGDALDRLRDTEKLIDRARRLQVTMTPPDVKTWQEFDAVVVTLENRCRRFHARYVHQRDALVALCDRLGARASVPGVPKRKVS